jgi:16S rRNA (guanine(966)-N(2))-methyltransferase RsmD
MRVIAGSAKGRRLFAVPGQSTRPITDRVKEALFNILADAVVDARFLDLFAGTGSVGIEALSRGASHATFVDCDRRAIATVRRNLEITHLADYATVLQRDAFRFAHEYASVPFDLIHVAPPQYQGLWSRTLHALEGSPLLVPGTLVVVQIYPKEFESLDLAHLVLSDQRTYGSTMLCFYEASSPPTADDASQSHNNVG